MNTTLKPRIVVSPYQQPVFKKHAFDISSKNHPVRKEILKHVGKIDLSVNFQEDTETVRILKIPGLIAFCCRIEQNGRVIGVGRSNAIISETSKYFDKIIQSASNYSLVDAISKLIRTVDTLRIDSVKQEYDYAKKEYDYSKEAILDSKEAMIDDAYKARDSYRAEEMITDKQRGYLIELINLHVASDDERVRLESEMNDYTKSEASKMIAGFQK